MIRTSRQRTTNNNDYEHASFHRPRCQTGSCWPFARQHRALSQARRLLAPYQNHVAWFRALEKYATLAPDLRAFTLRGTLRSDVSGYILRERVALYNGALA